MTDLTFKINNVSFAAYVKKGEYYTSMTPVAGAKYTDLNKVDHTTVIRHRGGLKVVFNPMSPTQFAALCTELENCPCEVKYFSFQKKLDVTQTMMPSLDDIQDAKQRSSGHWVRSFTLEFTEE